MGYLNESLPENKRLLQEGKNKKGCWMRIIDYSAYNDITVQFMDENRYTTHTSYGNFLNGSVKNKFHPVYGFHGYMGDGKYSTVFNDNSPTAFNIWSKMHQRSLNYDGRHPAYSDVTVSRIWWDFQNFHEWFDEKYYKVDGELMSLDKDIKFPGNRVYSPETCIIIPLRLNDLFVSGNQINKTNKSDLPKGVSIRVNPINITYRATVQSINKFGETKLVQKVFKTLEEARDFYIEVRITSNKMIAELYKSKIPTEVYDAIINYRDPEWYI